MNDLRLKNLNWLLISLLTIAADQISKYFVISHMEMGSDVHIASFFKFQFLTNKGAAFSFLNYNSTWQLWLLSSIAVAVCIWLIIWLLFLNPQQRGIACALSLIIGGALGNVLDRIQYGFVIDFIVFHYKKWAYPAFNIADSCICLGALLLIIHLWKEDKKKKNHQD